MIGDVAREYLGVDYEINIEDEIYLNNRDQFNILYDAYLRQSSFNKLKGDFRV